jgi:hypothetical protein
MSGELAESILIADELISVQKRIPKFDNQNLEVSKVYAMKAYLISHKYGDDDGLINAKNVDNDFKQLKGLADIPDDMMVAVGKLLQLIDEIMQEVGIEVREEGMVLYDQGEFYVGIPPGFIQTINKDKNMFTNDTNEEVKEEKINSNDEFIETWKNDVANATNIEELQILFNQSVQYLQSKEDEACEQRVNINTRIERFKSSAQYFRDYLTVNLDSLGEATEDERERAPVWVALKETFPDFIVKISTYLKTTIIEHDEYISQCPEQTSLISCVNNYINETQQIFNNLSDKEIVQTALQDLFNKYNNLINEEIMGNTQSETKLAEQEASLQKEQDKVEEKKLEITPEFNEKVKIVLEPFIEAERQKLAAEREEERQKLAAEFDAKLVEERQKLTAEFEAKLAAEHQLNEKLQSQITSVDADVKSNDTAVKGLIEEDKSRINDVEIFLGTHAIYDQKYKEICVTPSVKQYYDAFYDKISAKFHSSHILSYGALQPKGTSISAALSVAQVVASFIAIGTAGLGAPAAGTLGVANLAYTHQHEKNTIAAAKNATESMPEQMTIDALARCVTLSIVNIKKNSIKDIEWSDKKYYLSLFKELHYTHGAQLSVKFGEALQDIKTYVKVSNNLKLTVEHDVEFVMKIFGWVSKHEEGYINLYDNLICSPYSADEKVKYFGDMYHEIDPNWDPNVQPAALGNVNP